MNITLPQNKLKTALANCSRIAGAKTTLPILKTVHIHTKNNKVFVEATNLEIASTNKLSANIETEGSACVPAKLLYDFVASVPSDDVTLHTDENKLHISAHNYTATINTVDSSDFPELPQVDTDIAIHYQFTADDFKTMIDQTKYATSADVARPAITGVFWHTVDGKLYLAATDGYRLVERQSVYSSNDVAVIIPKQAINEAVQTLQSNDNIDVYIVDSQISFVSGNTSTTSQLIDGKYPDYRRIIPEKNTISFVASVEELLSAVKIASLFSRDSGNSITMTAQQDTSSITIASTASELGANATTLDLTVTGDGALNINAHYVLEALSSMDCENVQVSFSNTLAPLKIIPAEKSPQLTCVIMPLKS